MTPDELRKLAIAARAAWDAAAEGDEMDAANWGIDWAKHLTDEATAAADAWEFKVWQIEQVVVAKDETIVSLRKRLEEAEKYMRHLPECWKNAAYYELGVGGKLASCTCGLDAALAGEEK